MYTTCAAYTWEESPRQVTVTAVTPAAARVARTITRSSATRQDTYPMKPNQFRRFQRAFAKVCKHPPARAFAWTVGDVMYTGCCDCGTLREHVLKA